MKRVRSPRGTRAACRIGRHVAAVGSNVDAAGVEHGRCRHCGCELRRLPAIGRWFASAMMGEHANMTKV